MKCHEIDYRIVGDDLQYVEVELDPGESVIGEAGTMMYLSEGISFEAKMGDGTKPEAGLMDKLFDAGKRMLMGESLFLTHFTNRGQGKKQVAFAAPFPGSIIAIDMSGIKGPLLCQKDSFLCAALGTEVGIAFTRKLGTGLFGGEGFILQKIIGDGMVFVHAGGTVVQKELRGEKLLVDTGCLVAFESGIDYSIERAGDLKTMVFGGEGIFLASLSGTGKVWLQSMPFSRLRAKLLSGFNAQKESGSVLGGAAELFKRM